MAAERNELAMTHVMMAMGNDTLRSNVKSAANSSCPGGLAYEIIEKLNEEYRPVKKIDSVEKKNPKNAEKRSQAL